ncbi:hypothetical protein O1611_g7829 [Lasiodiplodia mahajangana]|uniref:Uncharacterized protein n=1 Tax=Lasiodiplodia mahajangana TaxID=1108764 RepID=A0ACC2JEB6_9PEZI|nr:hypothetical protein O1611_g7829 [Lasiodiplodia mahajangana]
MLLPPAQPLQEPQNLQQQQYHQEEQRPGDGTGGGGASSSNADMEIDQFFNELNDNRHNEPFNWGGNGLA